MSVRHFREKRTTRSRSPPQHDVLAGLCPTCRGARQYRLEQFRFALQQTGQDFGVRSHHCSPWEHQPTPDVDPEAYTLHRWQNPRALQPLAGRAFQAEWDEYVAHLDEIQVAENPLYYADRVSDTPASQRPRLASNLLQLREQVHIALYGAPGSHVPYDMQVRAFGRNVGVACDEETECMHVLVNPARLEELTEQHVAEIQDVPREHFPHWDVISCESDVGRVRVQQDIRATEFLLLQQNPLLAYSLRAHSPGNLQRPLPHIYGGAAGRVRNTGSACSTLVGGAPHKRPYPFGPNALSGAGPTSSAAAVPSHQDAARTPVRKPAHQVQPLPPKRKHQRSQASRPVTGAGVAAPASSSSHAAVQLTAAQPPCATLRQPHPQKAVILTYHGSFGPFHKGHRECIHSAVNFMIQRNFHVVRAVIGFTTEKKYDNKVGSALFANTDLRADIALAVLAEGPPPPVPIVVDRKPQSTSHNLSIAHETEGIFMIYVVGSDVMSNPDSRTIVVTRTSKEQKCHEYFDARELRGVCVQKRSLDVSSTIVRASLDQGRIPDSYEVQARALIAKALGQMQDPSISAALAAGPVRVVRYPVRESVPMMACSDSSSSYSSDSVECVNDSLDHGAGAQAEASTGSAARDSASVPGATAKCLSRPQPATSMSKDCATQAATVPGTQSTSLSVSDVAKFKSKLLLAAKRSSRAAVTTQLATEQPLTEQTAAWSAGPYQELSGAPDVQVAPPAEVPVAPLGHILRSPGVLKFQPPIFANLKLFWEKTVLPLCALFRVTPYLLGRRNGGDASLRLSYVPDMRALPTRRPFYTFATVAEMAEFTRCLWQVGGTVVTCARLSLDFIDCTYADIDIDTDHGAKVRLMLRKAIMWVSDKALLYTVHVAFFTLEAYNMVVVLRPLYPVAAITLAQDFCELFNIVLGQEQASADGPSSCMSVRPKPEYTGYVMGGSASPAHLVHYGLAKKRASEPKILIGGAPKLRSVAVPVFSPDGVCLDSLVVCWQWIVYMACDRCVSPSYLRTIASLWMRSAAKNHYLVVGHTVFDIASSHRMEMREYIDYYWDPEHARAPPTLFVHALACAFALRVSVVNEYGVRTDGLPVPSPWQLRLRDGTWQVWKLVDADECNNVSISTTLPFESVEHQPDDHPPSSSSPSSSLHEVSGGAKSGVKRPRSPSTDAPKSSSEQGPPTIHWPQWRIDDPDALCLVHVSIGNSPPISINVPESWDAAATERALAAHIACRHSWLEYTWARQDVYIEYSDSFPHLCSPTGLQLQDLFQNMPP
eukprot:6464139-Amphidinium_carterae.1